MKNIEIDHFKNHKFIGGLKSGGKDCLSFIVRTADIDENKYSGDIWLMPKGKKPFPLTQGGESPAYWWRSGNEIVFSAARNGKDREEKEKGLPLTILYKISAKEAGEAKEWLRLEHNVNSLEFIDENSFLFTAGWKPFVERALKNSESKDEAAAKIKDEADYEVLEDLPYWNNGGGFSKSGRNRLYFYNNGKIKAISGEKDDVSSVRLSPDKKSAYYVSAEFDKVCSLTDNIRKLDLSTLKEKKLKLGGKFSISFIEAADDKSLVVAASDMKKFGLNQNKGFYLLDTESGKMKCLYDSYEYSLYDSVGTDLKMAGAARYFAEDGFLYWLSTIGYSSHIMSLNLSSGEIKQLTEKDGAVHELSRGKDGEIYFTAMRSLGGVEIYRLGKGKEKRISDFNTALKKEYKEYKPHALSFENSKGNKIQGWVIKPEGYKEGKRFPAILDIHGGPKTVYGNIAYHEMQYWAAQGYGVFFCNPTGSDGGGSQFADIRGKYGGIDYLDIMEFTDRVLEANPWIDSKRLGVTGGSYGGFMTNWIIGHSNRFKAAASQRSISNWISMTLTTDIGYYFGPDQTASDVWESHDKMWEQSPLKYAHKVKTPTLFIHSDEDYRCWMAEGLQMYTALQIHGVDTRLCLFRGENHELSRSGKPKHRLRRLHEITSWFDKYLKK